jgi:hypothetical protein
MFGMHGDWKGMVIRSQNARKEKHGLHRDNETRSSIGPEIRVLGEPTL